MPAPWAQRFGDRIYAVARDVTARVAAERALVEAKAAAETANRAKSDFLANMSHEIRTPLNGVIGVIDALARTPLSPQQAEMVELVRSSSVTLERLVTDILDVSRIESGRMTLETRPFDLNDALIPAIAPLRGLAEEKGLTFRFERADAACGVFNGDVVRVRQILGNLLSNAVKFTAQGQVSVHVDLLDRGDGAVLLTLEGRDTGIGFGADHAAQLFQRFSQADASITRRFGGAGLGLSICHALTEMMGGRIEAESAPGEGSRFQVELPLTRIASLAQFDAAYVEEAASDAPSPGPRPRVLLAEDHPINQRVVQLILGDSVELMTPAGNRTFRLHALENTRGESIGVAPGDGHVVYIPVPEGLDLEYALLMRNLNGGNTRDAREPAAAGGCGNDCGKCGCGGS